MTRKHGFYPCDAYFVYHHHHHHVTPQNPTVSHVSTLFGGETEGEHLTRAVHVLSFSQINNAENASALNAARARSQPREGDAVIRKK